MTLKCNNFKVLNPILHCRGELYQKIADCSRKTWMSVRNEDVFSFFYQGGKETYFDGDTLNLDAPDGFGENREYVSSVKMIKAFEYCLENFDFDFLLRTSASTYVNYDSLIKLVDNLSVEDFYYGGSVGGKYWGDEWIPWVLGHSVLLSKKFVELVIKNKTLFLDFKYIDDVALGALAKNLKIKPKKLPLQKWVRDEDEAQNSVFPPTIRCKPLTGHKARNKKIYLTRITRLYNILYKRYN